METLQLLGQTATVQVQNENIQSSLQEMFDSFLKRQSLFLNKDALQAGYTPAELPHREQHITQLAKILAPSLRGEQASNVFIYGKPGTGKTVATRLVCSELERAADAAGRKLDVVYLNAKLRRVADTEYRLAAQLAEQFGVSVPATGLPTKKIYDAFFNAIDSEKRVAIIVLDEIDRLVRRAGDELLYNLTRMNSELRRAKVSLIGITNDITLLENLDSRIRSSLGEEELVFPPYNAVQLQDILARRAVYAFAPGALSEGIIPKCAAYAAREHGDARRALDLLRVSGETAERCASPGVFPEHVDSALEKLETDNVLEVIKTQPQQSKAVLYSIMRLKANNAEVSTGDVYGLYKGICDRSGQHFLTQRRVSDLISELEVMGILSSSVISKGRYGRSRAINLSVNPAAMDKAMRILKSEFAY